MQSKKQFCKLISRTISRTTVAALAIATVFALTVGLTQAAQAQTFKVIHTFTGGWDGGHPQAGLTMDQAGNFYGTTTAPVGEFWGTVFKLSHRGSGWVFNTLYSFPGYNNDGLSPSSGVIFGPDGSLYGTTLFGGGTDCPNNESGCGTVFNVRPPPGACKTALCPWTETLPYRFGLAGGADGYYPTGGVIFDHAGNIYGVTIQGGAHGGGTVYMLTPSGSGWTKNIIYSFTGGKDGALPQTGMIFDGVGNLYLTTPITVDELTPSNGSWIEHTLYGGVSPYPSGLVFDQSGNLYSTSGGNSGSPGGTVFELTPAGSGNWSYTLIYSFTTGSGGPGAPLVIDASGTLYGTTTGDGAYGFGNVFKLTPSGNGWTYTDLYDFTGGSDGANPWSNVVFDSNGNLYGTTYYGGTFRYGVVWEITP